MNKKLVFGILSILLVAALAWTLRMRAVNMLPIDWDEDDYMRAGQEYAHLIRTSDWSGFLETNYRPEHPPLAKITYGILFSFYPEQPLVPDLSVTDAPPSTLPDDLLQAGRTQSAVFGTVTTILLAFVNPLGGLLLAVHTFTIKYTSQVMLDALSAFLSLSAILAYAQFRKKNQNGWFIASAVLLGLAADSKYLHGTVGLAIVADWLIVNKESISFKKLKSFLPILGWGVLSLLVFFAFNPYLWADPIGRLQESFGAVIATTTNTNVESAGYPFWQQLNWLTMSVPWHNNPRVFVVMLDTFITFLAIIGFKRTWERHRIFALWLAIDMVILLVWRTKWPQYILIVTAPLCLSAAEGIALLWNQTLEGWRNRRKTGTIYKVGETRRALPWLVPGLVAFLLLTVFPLIFQFGVSMTDFNSSSIRDGFSGGIGRAIWEGITGQTETSQLEVDGGRSNQVRYTGLGSYPAVFNFITAGFGDGYNILFFNVMWTILSVAVQGGLGLAVALLLWQKGVRLGKFWQALFILPWAIPEMVGALMWRNVLGGEWSWLYLAAQKYGADSVFGGMVNTLNTSPSAWFLIYLIPAIWYGFPFMMLATSVGLKMVPKEVYDASSIDGASPMQTFRFITLPLLMPLLLPAIIVRGIFAFNQFYLFQAFFFGHATLATLSYNIFNPARGFGNVGGQFAASAVINIITVLILIVFVAAFNRWSKAGEGVDYA
jgi:arabinogalactan oligomer / maltooligosaccharide transport system permease protein